MEEELLGMRFGRGTVQKNLERAVGEGKLEMLHDGCFTLPKKDKSYSYLHIKETRALRCQFLNDFLFSNAYDKTAVPYGCRNCYKVKIVPTNFKGLIALRGILEETPFSSKCGIDFFNPHSQDIYAGILYLDGLDEARSAYRKMQTPIKSHPDLGCTVKMTIKRGCPHFEAACGPSNEWAFREGMADLEAALRKDFKLEHSNATPYQVRRMESMVAWLQFAYNLGDDSYLTFTGGRPLHRPTVAYQVEDSLPSPHAISRPTTLKNSSTSNVIPENSR